MLFALVNFIYKHFYNIFYYFFLLINFKIVLEINLSIRTLRKKEEIKKSENKTWKHKERTKHNKDQLAPFYVAALSHEPVHPSALSEKKCITAQAQQKLILAHVTILVG